MWRKRLVRCGLWLAASLALAGGAFVGFFTMLGCESGCGWWEGFLPWVTLGLALGALAALLSAITSLFVRP